MRRVLWVIAVLVITLSEGVSLPPFPKRISGSD